ncbi:MAG: triose-phosphate isomerase [Desulfobulbaceae bacterium]|uniref:Triosephosphate isomerase n=1 Tax=Candidatus Desulfobia pelagia TaxID=2841692 RepID=A0A8J6NH09_9BACT|nr:triose-phosphate isomerase [Candidatus Desulfobia pelagia]
MQRKPLIAGNWKMHTTIAEAEKLARAICENGIPNDREVMVAPPFTAMKAVSGAVAGSGILVGAQNVCWEEKGAFTGEISPVMLQDAGCVMAILGHSERRHIFGENDTLINKRVAGALKFGLVPVLCIGEKLEEREAERTFQVLEEQLRKGLEGISLKSADELVVAYEPVWAIGTGKTATIDQAQEVHVFVRSLLRNLYEKNIATGLRILYGGSVNSKNVDDLMGQEDIDGALVGGAALDSTSFSRIINFK